MIRVSYVYKMYSVFHSYTKCLHRYLYIDIKLTSKTKIIDRIGSRVTPIPT